MGDFLIFSSFLLSQITQLLQQLNKHVEDANCSFCGTRLPFRKRKG